MPRINRNIRSSKTLHMSTQDDIYKRTNENKSQSN